MGPHCARHRRSSRSNDNQVAGARPFETPATDSHSGPVGLAGHPDDEDVTL